MKDFFLSFSYLKKKKILRIPNFNCAANQPSCLLPRRGGNTQILKLQNEFFIKKLNKYLQLFKQELYVKAAEQERKVGC